MSTRASSRTCLAAIACVLAAEASRAEPPPVSPTAGAPATAPAASPPPNPGAWGWYVVASGVVAGGLITTYGLTFDCAENDGPCEHHASIAIWSGIGVAALATAIGVSIVEAGRVKVKLAPTASAGSPLPGLTVRASF